MMYGVAELTAVKYCAGKYKCFVCLPTFVRPVPMVHGEVDTRPDQRDESKTTED